MDDGGVEVFHELFDEGLVFDGFDDFGGDSLDGCGGRGGGFAGGGSGGGGVFGDLEGEFEGAVGDGAEGFFDLGAGCFVGEAALVGGAEEDGVVGGGVEGEDFAGVAEDGFEVAGGVLEVLAGGGPDGGEVGEVGDFLMTGGGSVGTGVAGFGGGSPGGRAFRTGWICCCWRSWAFLASISSCLRRMCVFMTS